MEVFSASCRDRATASPKVRPAQVDEVQAGQLRLRHDAERMSREYEAMMIAATLRVGSGRAKAA